MVAAPKPMKAVTGDLPSSDDGWTYEIKWDGFRAIAVVDHGTVTVYSSNGLDVTAKRSELLGLPDALHAESAVLDGELVAFDDDGRPRFELVGGGHPVTFIVFDLLSLNGTDVTELAYRDRRRLLEAALEPGPNWLVSTRHEGPGAGADLLEATRDQGLEGLMAKRTDSPYLPGKRSPAWRKVKHRRRQELVIGGWTAGSGNRATTLGALLVGRYEGDVLRYAGGIGTGFTQRTLAQLSALLAERTITDCPFAPRPTAIQLRHQRPHWVRPDLVCEVAFAEWTIDGVVRHASYLGLRDDKDPRDVVREPG